MSGHALHNSSAGRTGVFRIMLLEDMEGTERELMSYWKKRLPQSHIVALAVMWVDAKKQADVIFGTGNWHIVSDQSLPGGYITANDKEDGRCIAIK